MSFGLCCVVSGSNGLPGSLADDALGDGLHHHPTPAMHVIAREYCGTSVLANVVASACSGAEQMQFGERHPRLSIGA